MGIKQDVKESLKDFPITKIDGQPTDKDLNRLASKLSEMAATIPTTNGRRLHGHVGMIVGSVQTTFSNGNAPFMTPMNPGSYPMVADQDGAICEQQVVEHKAKIKEF